MRNIRNVLLVFVLICAAIGSGIVGYAQVVNRATLTGTLHVVWGLSQNHDEQIVYMLAEPNGRTTRLDIAQDIMTEAGGIDALNRQQVSVQVIQARGVQPPLTPLTVREISRINHASTSRAQSRISGSLPWITLMCKFSDVATEPQNYAYFNGMYGSTYPGFNHYWQEQSYNTINIDGSGVAGSGWFTLPSPRSTYVVNGSLNFGLISQDCASAADSVVNFSNYVGINMMFNADLDGYAWGGSTTLAVDGSSGWWSTTWMPPWGYSDVTVLAHEMGHGFGLPHSSGQYGETYDNVWDVMSDTWQNCYVSWSPTYGCLGQHTIAYHKDKLGWIPNDQKYLAYGSATIVIDDLAMASTTNYRMARIPINKVGTRYYTVEVRKLTGYDVKLPGFAVVIHQVDTTRDRPAQVIDIDGNGNTGDAGAMWTTGETFSDAAIGLTVAVNTQTANGYSVTISVPVSTPTQTSTHTPTRIPTVTQTRTPTTKSTRTRTPKPPTRTSRPTPARPAVFDKLRPIKSAVNRPTNITLSWATSARATSYEYCISTIKPCSNWRNVGNVRSVTVSNLLRNKVYYWHVRARNTTGTTNSADGVWRFTTAR